MKSKIFEANIDEDLSLEISSEVLRDCSLDTVEVQKDDIIILSSDGLWDVIKADQLQEIMERNTNQVN
jgi:serine/threonine protein phosphatase PrpC